MACLACIDGLPAIPIVTTWSSRPALGVHCSVVIVCSWIVGVLTAPATALTSCVALYYEAFAVGRYQRNIWVGSTVTAGLIMPAPLCLGGHGRAHLRLQGRACGHRAVCTQLNARPRVYGVVRRPMYRLVFTTVSTAYVLAMGSSRAVTCRRIPAAPEGGMPIPTSAPATESEAVPPTEVCD